MDLPKIVAHRADGGWMLEMDGIAPAYVRRLSEAAECGSALMKAAAVPGVEHGVQLKVDLGDELNRRVKASTQATIDAHKAQLQAAAELRRTASALKSEDMTGRDIAHILGVSPQRVSQLLAQPATGG
ncbi:MULTISPECIES: hypothetical protein [Streptomyces]|uniref:hypothetical protein n=1 Tax=Streptomyces TaxID=1883 RepID=UPI000A092143|nr:MULTISPECIES: hypothetical protein [Streptomyces]GGW17665.1 hypothetical protein GCM10010264_74170 [Streptomyces globisporus]ARI56205.1 hypothetical protein A6E92_31560 [Streptomyces sp. S8]MBK5992633.1 hypothetical protein [Streptomyces sp. MBT58]WSR89019.1 hypothetical protein OG728_00525 [Streptomyces microflavus]WSR90233.1 hypothetical protein OG728_07385 [Streptomyces microflavus]